MIAALNTRLAAVEARLPPLDQGLATLPSLTPPACTVPGGDKLQYDGVSWMCVCLPGWSGVSCSIPPSPPPPSPSPSPPPLPPTPPPLSSMPHLTTAGGVVFLASLRIVCYSGQNYALATGKGSLGGIRFGIEQGGNPNICAEMCAEDPGCGGFDLNNFGRDATGAVFQGDCWFLGAQARVATPNTDANNPACGSTTATDFYGRWLQQPAQMPSPPPAVRMLLTR